MFGSSPFGQSSSSPFGSQPVFGQTNNATNNSNPFAPQPFGGSSPFGAQTGSSIFGGMSTGVFGSQTSSPLGSTSVFGAQSSPAFGNSAPAFGANTGASPFGQPKPAFGGFGSNTTTTPFGQQSQSAFGSSPFGATTPFSAPSQPAFGASSSSPAFGTPNASPFGGTSASAFGSTASPGFGNTTGAFGSSPFGSAPAFGVTPTTGFGGTTASAFGSTAAPGFGSTTTSAFGATTSAPAFGNSTSAFNFGSSPGFGQSTSTFGTSSFGQQSSAFGSQSSTPAFGQSTFGAQRVGSRVAAFTPTPEADAGAGTPGKLESISAMPVYKEKSHEELRWEDYQAGDKGGPSPAGQSTSAIGFNNPGIGSSSPSLFTQSSANPFSSSTSTNPFAPKTPAVNNSAFGSSPATGFGSSPFGQSNTSNLFGSTSSASSSLFGSTTQAFGANTSSPNLFSSAGTSGFGSQSIFNSAAPGTTSAFSTGSAFGNTQSSPLFQSSTPALPQTSSPFGQNTSAFGQTTSAFGQTTTAFGQQSNLFNTPSTGFGGSFFSSSSSLLSNSNPVAGFGQAAPSLTTAFQSSQPAQSSGGFSFSNFGQTQAAPSSAFGLGGTPGLFGQSTFGQSPAPQSSVITQAAPITNPFGTLPAMPQMSIGRPGSSPSIQYGISSLPVVEKTVAPRISSLLTSRHISQRRMALPIRRYHPNADGPKVPFFNDDEEAPSTPKADALFVPRENPRALVIRPLEQWPSRSGMEKTTSSNVKGTFVRENGTSEESMGRGLAKEQENPVNGHEKTNGVHDGPYKGKGDSLVNLTGHRAGEAAIVYEHGADIEALMPKLRHSDYYTEPRIQEIAAKERAQPGYSRQVKNFIVGRHGYGSIKFFGETDVRRLDLESLVQFNNREVIVYMDESKKPPVGQGLNKPAEVSLLNIKCVDKKSGQQYTEGPRVEKYVEMLKRKAEDQGAEFVSYDPAKGEWKFRVDHFSRYKLIEEDDESGEHL